MIKDIEKVIAYSRECKSWLGRSHARFLAKEMKYREDIVSNKELNCFDKLRQIFASPRYDLGEYNETNAGEFMEYQKAERIAFNHTVKLINEIVKFDTVEVLEEETLYSRKTDNYSVTLQVKKFRMELMVFKGNDLYMHRTGGDGVYKGDLSFTEYSSVIKKADLGALNFSNGGRSDVIELSYTFPKECYSEMVNRLKELLKKKGFTYNLTGTQSGLWRLFPHKYEECTMIMRCMTVNITMQHIYEGIELYNQLLKDEGLEK